MKRFKIKTSLQGTKFDLPLKFMDFLPETTYYLLFMSSFNTILMFVLVSFLFRLCIWPILSTVFLHADIGDLNHFLFNVSAKTIFFFVVVFMLCLFSIKRSHYDHTTAKISFTFTGFYSNGSSYNGFYAHFANVIKMKEL